MTKQEITQIHKRLESAWQDLEVLAHELEELAHTSRGRLRAAFAVLVEVDRAIDELSVGGAQ
jgi:hypothetical protein